jgi:TetR/AcrR family transcriptional regulator
VSPEPVSDPVGQPPPGKKARTRQTIMRVAGDMFADRGVLMTTVEEIAEAAEVSVGTVYKHFGSKNALALAFISEAITVVEGYMAQARTLESPIERVYAAGDAYFRFALEHPAACRFASQRVLQRNANPDFSSAHEEMSKRTQKMVLGIATDLKEAMNKGELAPAPIDESIVFIWGLWNGVTALVIRADGTAIPPEMAQRAFGLARSVMRRASAHARMFPGQADTWPDAGGDWPEYAGYSPSR